MASKGKNCNRVVVSLYFSMLTHLIGPGLDDNLNMSKFNCVVMLLKSLE